MNRTMKHEITSDSEKEGEQYFTFYLKDTLYGIKIDLVREIIEYDRIYRVPCVPEHIAGIINVRGEIIPIIDLSQKMFSRRQEWNRFSAIAIVEVPDKGEKVPAGILVDRVNRVMEIRDNDVTTPQIGYKIRADYMKGIASDGENFILLLNVEQLMNIDEISGQVSGERNEVMSGIGIPA